MNSTRNKHKFPESKIINNQKYLPYRDSNKCKWIVPPDFNENTALFSLGNLQYFFALEQITDCEINFNEVTWADPNSLLYLGLIFAESKLNKKNILIYIGETNNKDHQIFLKFFARQGFLVEIAKYSQIIYKKKTVTSVEDLRLELEHLRFTSYFLNSSCINAKIIKVNDYKNNRILLQRKVEEFLLEAKDRSGHQFFFSDPFARDVLFQKIRKILYELVLNISEHSKEKSEDCFAGIYARIRSAKPPVHSNSKMWLNLFDQKTRAIYGQRTFTPNYYAEWLELYVCDIGVGLTNDINTWCEHTTDPEILSILKKAKSTDNTFLSIVDQLFHLPLSRQYRHKAQRTAVTGLQHLGHLLSRDQDHCRIYTHNGGWAGDHFPWAGKRFSRKDTNIQSTIQNYKNLIPVPGTSFSFSIQPNHNIIDSDFPWETLSDKIRLKLIESLKEKTKYESKSLKILSFDHRNKDSFEVPNLNNFNKKQPIDAIILRPPRLMSKHDFGSWLELLAGTVLKTPIVTVKQVIFADLTPFQTLIFHELLKGVQIHKDTHQSWFLVSEKWTVCSLTSEPNKGMAKFISDKNKAKTFLLEKSSVLPFNIIDLAILLREMDSIIFWKYEKDHGKSPFFNHDVIWDSSHNEKDSIKLNRYLDFSIALVESERYQACLRALKRSLSLFPKFKPVSADDLVTSLVREASLSTTYEASEKELSKIFVGSISVTGNTMKNLMINSDVQTINIFNQSEVHDKTINSLSALIWVTQLPNYNQHIPSKVNGKPWRRIPNTPHIAPLGEKSISVLRYRRNDNDHSLNFDDPYYARTPEETYNDFDRLGILKLGHWKYGSRHDLLTINMRLAFRFSFLEKGPLYIWLLDQFENFFSKPNNKNIKLLLYPSHPVTDTLFDRIRQDKSFARYLPEGGMIPIKFLGKRTVSPLLASHLVKHRITNMRDTNNWKDKKWKAVIFDDGTISGKHLRETTQFLKSLGANYVYLIATLDRSGLPVEESVYKKFFEKHKRFWRWDVPSLGNKRNCPFCKALAIIKTYLPELTSYRQKARLNEWMVIWKLRDVDTEWYEDTSKQTCLDHTLKITFGIDPENVNDGSPVEKRLTFTNSTSATSLLMELTRLTTRTDVTIKKAEKLSDKASDASLEMISSQLLLFIDELNKKEKIERYQKLIEWSWLKSDEDSYATSLSGICLFLVEDELINTLWYQCEQLLQKELIKNYDTLVFVSFLCSRYEFLNKKIYRPKNKNNKFEIKNYLSLGRRVNLNQNIGGLLTQFISNPSNPEQANIHQTEIKKIIDKQISIYEEQNVYLIYQSMNQLKDITISLQNEYCIDIPDSSINDLDFFTEQINKTTKCIEKQKEYAEKLGQILYGNTSKPGIIKLIQDQLFHFSKGIEELDINFISKFIRNIQKKWGTIISNKIDDYSQNDDCCDLHEITYWLSVKNNERHSISNDIHWNKKEPVICKSSVTLEDTGMWFYCDKHCKTCIEDTFLNVIHATEKILDPFNSDNDGITRAHLWWCAQKVDNNFLKITTANATKNKKINLKQRVSISCIERIGGKVDVAIDDSKEPFIAYTKLYLPLFNFFLRKKNEF